MVWGDSCEEIVNKLQPRNGSVYEMSKLQHLNLMRIVGLCVELEKTRDFHFFLFGQLDEEYRPPLDWPKRMYIIQGKRRWNHRGYES
ncbi:hypothetical protein F2Q70_00013755 [Brassica cretica]|uniref:Serine-threonine/tyrosine-protein kinase catalytic domain-containing protein n=1 Tax=Brassica cretica TaxID=69181 RepID=A0A8S9M2U5_BRACR|nr:hypothetical protein F2Q70_00013755 [Brassica cretica]